MTVRRRTPRGSDVNLHGIASGIVGAVNPQIPAELRISNGYSVVSGGGGSRTPAYESPGSFTGSIAGTTLTVTAQTAG